MSSSNRYSTELFRVQQLLSQRVSHQDKFFKEIALMDIESRKVLAMLYVLINDVKIFELDFTKMDELELIEKVLYKFVQRIGQAQFRADPLTHLGFKLGIDSDAWNWEQNE